MAYGRRRSTRRTYRAAPRRSYRSRPVRRRRTSTRRRATSRQRTIRIVVQTVAASPVALGMKGAQPTRRMF